MVLRALAATPSVVLGGGGGGTGSASAAMPKRRMGSFTSGGISLVGTIAAFLGGKERRRADGWALPPESQGKEKVRSLYLA